MIRQRRRAWTVVCRSSKVSKVTKVKSCENVKNNDINKEDETCKCNCKLDDCACILNYNHNQNTLFHEPLKQRRVQDFELQQLHQLEKSTTHNQVPKFRKHRQSRNFKKAQCQYYQLEIKHGLSDALD